MENAICETSIYQLNDVAALLGLHVETLRRRIRSGELTAAYVCGKYIILGSHLMEFLEGNVGRFSECGPRR